MLKPLFVLTILIASFKGAAILGYYLARKIHQVRDISAAFILFLAVPGTYLALYATQALESESGVSLVLIIMGILVLRFFTGLYNPHMQQFYARLVPDEHRAAILSLKSTAGTATTIILLGISGMLLQSLGLGVGFLLAGGFALASLILIGFVWYISPDPHKMQLDGIRKVESLKSSRTAA